MKIVDLPVKDDLEGSINKMEREYENNTRMHLVIAKYKKMQFDNYLAVGFTPDQALHLVLSN